MYLFKALYPLKSWSYVKLIILNYNPNSPQWPLTYCRVNCPDRRDLVNLASVDPHNLHKKHPGPDILHQHLNTDCGVALKHKRTIIHELYVIEQENEPVWTSLWKIEKRNECSAQVALRWVIIAHVSILVAHESNISKIFQFRVGSFSTNTVSCYCGGFIKATRQCSSCYADTLL